MPLKIYKRIGIRRDKNLSDVNDSKASLNNILDGLATGLPAIVSDACSSFINEGGIVIKERNVNAWKEGIRNQIHNRREWEKMVLKAPNDVKGLDPDSDKSRWQKVYDEIIEIHSKID